MWATFLRYVTTDGIMIEKEAFGTSGKQSLRVWSPEHHQNNGTFIEIRNHKEMLVLEKTDEVCNYSLGELGEQFYFIPLL